MSVPQRLTRVVSLTALAGLLLATAATAPVAHAATPAATGELQAAIAARIQALDRDGDGRLSASEHDAISQLAFARMDRGGDGSVSVAEIEAMRAVAGADAGAIPSAAELMARIDGDGNGQLSAAEHANGGKAMFGQMDADADGFITATEMQAAYATLSGSSQ